MRKILVIFGFIVAIPFLFFVSLIGVAAFGGSSASAAGTCSPASVGIGGQLTIKGKPITAEQRQNAETVIGVGKTRGFSRRDVKIALNTAIQESSLLNLSYGDRDSLGIFQQRPSQGWGTPAQVTDPVYASNRFYNALSEVENRDQMTDEEVALAVQKPDPAAYRSPFNNFNDWGPEAEALLGGTEFQADGDEPTLENCTYGVALGTISDPGPGPQSPENGLVPRAENLRLLIMNTWGCDKLRQEPCVSEIAGQNNRPAGTPQDHTLGLALDVTISDRIGVAPNAQQAALGWQIACTLKTNANQLGVQYQIWNGLIWNIDKASEGGPGRCDTPTGWRLYTLDGVAPTDVVNRHDDHIHITVQPGVGG